MTTSDSLVLTEHRDGYTILTLNRPDDLNALSEELIRGLRKALLSVRKNSKNSIVIITGAGRAFCAGADIKALNRMSLPQVEKYLASLSGTFLSLRRSDQIFIAAVNGYAIGGGAELVLNCDLVVAADTAKIAFPEIKLGLIPGASGTVLLPLLIGPLKAKELLLTGRTITASEAQAIGLVNQVVPAHTVLTTCIQLAEELAQKSTLPSQNIKKVFGKLSERVVFSGLKAERKGFLACFASSESRQRRREFELKK